VLLTALSLRTQVFMLASSSSSPGVRAGVAALIVKERAA
jgi:hypothetical protein